MALPEEERHLALEAAAGNTALPNDRALCGWRVRSALTLSELPLWTGNDRAPDIEISIGYVPDNISPQTHATPFLQIAESGVCRFEISTVAAFLIENGRTITIAPHIDPAAAELRVFLLGTVFGILCHQRGVLPLHASCVSINGRAVAFAGASGAGKSTLALALARRGHPLLSDDVCVVDWRAPGGPLVLPSALRLRLWRDALDRFAISTDGLERSRPDMEKYHLDHNPGFQLQPQTLTALYSLSEARLPREQGFYPLIGVAAVEVIGENVYRRRPAVRMSGGFRRLFEAATHVAAMVRVAELRRPDNLTGIDSLAEAVERHALGEAP
jgi:hypothetical protein